MSREVLNTLGLLSVAFILALGQLLFKLTALRSPAIERLALTYAYPFAAVAFVLVPFGAAVFFDERLTIGILVGTALIVLGICVTGLSRS